jgi:hypothetical protein
VLGRERARLWHLSEIISRKSRGATVSGRSGERTRPRARFPASRRKTLFGETPNTTREDAYAPRTLRRRQHFGTSYENRFYGNCAP